MSNGYKLISYGFLASQILIMVISFLLYNELSMLHYINISFYLASSMLFLSLIIYTVNSGFFDAISHSFRNVFISNTKDEKKKSIDEISPLSTMLDFNYFPLVGVGLLNLIMMLIGLFLYYN